MGCAAFSEASPQKGHQMLQNLFLYAGLILLVKTIFVAGRTFPVRNETPGTATLTSAGIVVAHVLATFACFATSLHIAGLLTY